MATSRTHRQRKLAEMAGPLAQVAVYQHPAGLRAKITCLRAGCLVLQTQKRWTTRVSPSQGWGVNEALDKWILHCAAAHPPPDNRVPASDHPYFRLPEVDARRRAVAAESDRVDEALRVEMARLRAEREANIAEARIRSRARFDATSDAP